MQRDYIGIQKTILPILEQEGFFKEVVKKSLKRKQKVEKYWKSRYNEY